MGSILDNKPRKAEAKTREQEQSQSKSQGNWPEVTFPSNI